MKTLIFITLFIIYSAPCYSVMSCVSLLGNVGKEASVINVHHKAMSRKSYVRALKEMFTEVELAEIEKLQTSKFAEVPEKLLGIFSGFATKKVWSHKVINGEEWVLTTSSSGGGMTYIQMFKVGEDTPSFDIHVQDILKKFKIELSLIIKDFTDSKAASNTDQVLKEIYFDVVKGDKKTDSPRAPGPVQFYTFSFTNIVIGNADVTAEAIFSFIKSFNDPTPSSYIE